MLTLIISFNNGFKNFKNTQKHYNILKYLKIPKNRSMMTLISCFKMKFTIFHIKILLVKLYH